MKNAMALTGLIILLSITAFSQQNPPENKKDALNSQPELKEMVRKTPRASEKKKETVSAEIIAGRHIQNLKNGILLVRLRTSENAITSLRNAGNEQMAATLRRRQAAENQRLIAAFQQHFTFCPVYFFFSSNSEKIKNGEYKGAFVNENLEPAADPEVREGNFYVAEITDMEQYRPEPEALNASNNGEVTFRALVIRDNNFHQLNRPFPYFIKASQNIPPRKRSEPEMVMLLNDKLNSFYKNVTKKR